MNGDDTQPDLSRLHRIRLVLVRPAGPANIGSVCRAMANMGLSQLVLVSPACVLDHPDTLGFAAHGLEVLSHARVVGDLQTGLNGCVSTFATTARLGLYRRQAAIAPQPAAAMAYQDAAHADVAFVFGPERTGLENADLLKIDRIVQIPADPGYPVLNLAAAALIICYELRKVAIVDQTAVAAPGAPGASPPSDARQLADDGRKVVMFERLFDSLSRIGFFFGPNPDHLKYALRHLLGRANLSAVECDILIGLARQIRWHVDHHPDPGSRDSNANPPAPE